MQANGVLHKNKHTLEGSYAQIRRRRLELEKSRRALLTQIRRVEERKERAEKARRQKEQLEIAQKAFKKLLLGKQRGKDPYEDPNFSSPSAAEQIIKVINMRRSVTTKRGNLITEFESYLPWGTEINLVNTHLPKEMKLTRNEVLLLFLNWDKIKRIYGKAHPEMFTLEKQNFAARPEVEQRKYKIEVRTEGRGPFATFNVAKEKQAPRPQRERPTRPLSPAQQVRKKIQQETPVLSRKQKKRLQREQKRKGKKRN